MDFTETVDNGELAAATIEVHNAELAVARIEIDNPELAAATVEILNAELAAARIEFDSLRQQLAEAQNQLRKQAEDFDTHMIATNGLIAKLKSRFAPLEEGDLLVAKRFSLAAKRFNLMAGKLLNAKQNENA